MEKVALLSTSIIGLIFLLGYLSSYLDGQSAKNAIKKPSVEFVAGISTPNRSGSSGATFTEGKVGNFATNNLGSQATSVGTPGE